MYDSGTDPGYIEPPEHKRVYYRHTGTGDLGYAVEKNGKPYMKYDRPNEERVVPFNAPDWMQEEEYRPIPEAQIIQVAFEADSRLCLLLGYHDIARRTWLDLTERQKVIWLQRGPSKPAIRRRLYLAITDVLKGIDHPDEEPELPVKKKRTRKKKVNGSNTKKG
jgi:hypothetical protein